MCKCDCGTIVLVGWNCSACGAPVDWDEYQERKTG